MIKALLKLLLKSPLRKVLYGLQMSWLKMNDVWLGIDTSHSNVGQGAAESVSTSEMGQAASSPLHDDAVEYGSVDYRNIRRSLNQLGLGPGDVFIDIGCGKGRVLCMASRRPLQKAIGIELFEGLAAVARTNAGKVRGRRAPVEVRAVDACTADLSEGTVFYLFNPFGAETMRDVLANLKRSLDARPRPIRICYFNPKQEHVFEECHWLQLSDSFRTWGGSRVTFWMNR